MPRLGLGGAAPLPLSFCCDLPEFRWQTADVCASREGQRERERRERESKSVGSAANNTSYTVLQASSHVFSQQEAELSLHFAFGNEFISVVNTVECFFISSLSLLSLSLPLFLSALYSFWPQPVAKPQV